MAVRKTFSLRGVFLTLSVASLFAAALGSPWSAWSSMLLWLLSCTVPGCLALGICCGQGTERAFCIGSLFPAVFPLYIIASELISMGNGYTGYSGTSYERIAYFLTGGMGTAFFARPVVGTAWLLALVAGTVTAIVYRVAVWWKATAGTGP